MSIENYQIPIGDDVKQTMAIAWLKLGVASLVFAGLFSILLVLSRTPAIQEMIPFTDFFHVALVVHVDLSVLIWFVSFAGVLWSLSSKGAANALDKTAIVLAVLGTVIITVAPFLGVGNPLMNNYIPILDHPLYIGGLMIFAAGMVVQIVRRILSGMPPFSKLLSSPSHANALDVGVYVSAWVALFSILALVASYVLIPASLEGTGFYEILFWGGGHILQFTHTVLLLVAWFWTASACGVDIKLSPKIAVWLFILVVAPVMISPWIYVQYDVLSGEHRLAYTDLMKYGGLASMPLGLAVVWGILTSSRCPEDKKPVKAALLSSIVLFAAGGIIGFMIEGVNVVIPAHYHGSIVGVTLAFMGLAYHLLPVFGFSKPTSKVAHWQPYVYGVGQLLHIIGLAWSGGYGVQRKTAGAAQGLENFPEIAGMALMGAGGAISIVGGILFVVVMIKAFMRPTQND